MLKKKEEKIKKQILRMRNDFDVIAWHYCSFFHPKIFFLLFP
jgi:hypothetical protein